MCAAWRAALCVLKATGMLLPGWRDEGEYVLSASNKGRRAPKSTQLPFCCFSAFLIEADCVYEAPS